MSQPDAPQHALPSTPQPWQAPSAWVWRSGKTLVTLHGVRFPSRCVKCNGPAVEPVKARKVYWHHPAYYFLIFGGVLIYAIVALIARKQATVTPGLCVQHRQRRRAWIAVGWLGPAVGVYFMAASWSGGAGVATGALLGLGSAVLGVLMSQIVAPTRIDERYVHLNGCGEAFLAGLPRFPDQGRR